jgi:stress response protein YsnF
MEAVPVEKVRLGKQTVAEEQTVTGEVRKEQIEVTDDARKRRP